MPPTSADSGWSIAPTVAWFAALLGAALLVVDGDLDGVRGLVDRAPGVAEDDVGPRVAGPAFMRRDAERAERAHRGDADDDWDPASAGAPPVRIADAGDDAADDDDAPAAAAKPAGAAIEDVCVDGTDDACRRWAMDGWYDAAARAAKGGLARMSLWGDSVTAEGHIAAGIRARLGKTYADGGAGFVFLAKPSRWYQNTAVRQSQSKGWVVRSVVHNGAADERHGYGGAEFVGTPGDSVTFRTAKSGPGSKASRVEIYYLAYPGGGSAEVKVDGAVHGTIDTDADATASGFYAISLDDGAHAIELKVTSGKVRAYGVVMERDAGVVVDSLGIVSNTARNLGNIDAAHWKEQLAHRDADLLMVLLGANESAWLSGKEAMKRYRAEWAKVLKMLRAGNPDASCLVIGTLDAGKLVDGKKYQGRASLDGMIEVERAAARAHGCAFWDARAFMGGKGSAKTWWKKGLMSGDFEHLTKKGGELLGKGIVDALQTGYAGRTSR